MVREMYKAITTPVTTSDMSEYWKNCCCCCCNICRKITRRKQCVTIVEVLGEGFEETSLDYKDRAGSKDNLLWRTRRKHYGAIPRAINTTIPVVKQPKKQPNGISGSSSSMLSTVDESPSSDSSSSDGEESSGSSSSDDGSGSDCYSTVSMVTNQSYATNSTQVSWGTRADDLSLAEQGGKHGSGSESIASSERLGGYEGDTQNIVGEPADEGLIAGVGDDILYPEEALLDPSQRDPVSICGEMDVVFQYSGEARRMNVTIVQAYNLPTKEQGGSSSYRVRLLLYPTKRQRAKTRIREGSDPQYKELFRFTRLYPHELVSMVLRLRLYGSERMRRERLIGEGRVKFSSLNTATQQMVRVKLESKSEIATGGSGSPYSSSSDLSHSESNSSLPTLQGGHGNIPELLVGLSYNATTGRLGVEIIKGSHFKHLSGGRAPDSYVKVALMSSSGFEMTKSKTSVRRGQPHPTFKETFIFQVAQFQLADVTLLFTVFNKKGMKRKDTIGWFSMGLSNSSEEELAHWNEMRESRGQQVSRWHALIDS
ncbi:synaptotagmin-16-like isoform X3 [Amphiura filiformis]|uniref:synaptotagmin-16-like isoform X3 n=1 Tax=Amphiura filiformis TaxID=82378 RepID=UPI003B221A40